jgi:RNA polymerase-binding transcription factor DksA
MRPEEARTCLSPFAWAAPSAEPGEYDRDGAFVIAMQSTHRRVPVPPHPLPPSDGPPEQRRDDDQGTGAPSPRFQQLLVRLEEGYEFHTRQLTELSPRPAGSAQAFDRDSLAAASRRALTVIAAALRDMAEGRYGICRSCGEAIPLERLEARPEARHCIRCQASSTG